VSSTCSATSSDGRQHRAHHRHRMNLGYNIRRMVHLERVAAFARLSVLLISQDRNRGKRVFFGVPI